MVVDSSALIAILLKEPECEEFQRKLTLDVSKYVSPMSVVEASNVMFSFGGMAGVARLDALLDSISAQIVPIDAQQTALARAALQVFGKGRHPAQLNLGDAFTYALAKHLAEPVLCKGNDFVRTDIAIA